MKMCLVYLIKVNVILNCYNCTAIFYAPILFVFYWIVLSRTHHQVKMLNLMKILSGEGFISS